MVQDEDKRKLLDDYKKAVASNVTGRNTAVPGSPARDITAEETAKWLRSVCEELAENSHGRELVGSAAEAISSIAKILSSVQGVNPYIGLACAGVCILTLVRS
jgi:predicted RNase H-like nuclease (RuvC/YqgF family)